MNKLQSIRKACKLTDQAYSIVLKNIRIGISEKELAREVQKYFKSNGARLAFRSIIAFGKSASEVHHKPTNLRLNKKHGFIMIDMGVKLNGYCSDMTRTVFFGKANKKQRKIYQTVLKAQQKSIRFIKSSMIDDRSVDCRDVDHAARKYITERGFPTIPHSVGHGIGKKVHEKPKISPVSDEVLTDRTIFTIEPGIYIKGFGGVRIEDVFYLNNGKLIQLTKSPKNLTELITINTR